MPHQSFNDSSSTKARKTKRKFLLLIISISIFACSAGIFIIGAVSLNVYKQSPKLVEGVNVPSEFMDTYSLSQEQVKIVEMHGYPDSFSIFFYLEEFYPNYDGEVREESWRYYEKGLEFTFYNGALIAEDSFTLTHGELAPNFYRPEQFKAYTSLQGVLASAEIHDLMEIPLEKSLIPEGTLYYAPGLSFGLVDNQLIYVETITLETEGNSNEQY